MLDQKYYRTEGVPAFINEPLTIEQWLSYVSDYTFGSVPPWGVVLHHTWSPTLAQWRGLANMRGMQGYYGNTLKWGAAPHIYTGPDAIWLAHPMHLAGIHANAANYEPFNAAYTSSRDGRVYVDNSKVRRYTIGVEMVGNYDPNRPNDPVWLYTKAVLGGLCRRFGWNPHEAITFHRDYSPKTCPGRAVTHEWVRAEVAAWLRGTAPIEQPALGGLTAVAPARMSSSRFIAVLNEAQSPAAPLAGELYRICVEEGIDPAVALAFFQHESSYGTKGICAEYDLKNWGNVRSPELMLFGTMRAIPGRGNFAEYPTWQYGLRDFCRRLRGPKYAGSGLHTVEAIIPKYAPSSDGNNVQRYIDALVAQVAAWQREAPVGGRWIARWRSPIRQAPNSTAPIAGYVEKGEVYECGLIKDDDACEEFKGDSRWLWRADGLGFCWAGNFTFGGA